MAGQRLGADVDDVAFVVACDPGVGRCEVAEDVDVSAARIGVLVVAADDQIRAGDDRRTRLDEQIVAGQQGHGCVALHRGAVA